MALCVFNHHCANTCKNGKSILNKFNHEGINGIQMTAMFVVMKFKGKFWTRFMYSYTSYS